MAGQWEDACGVVDESEFTSPLPTADTWHLIEIHVVPGDPLYEVYLDGVLLFSVDETRDPSDANSITAGLFSDFVTATSLAYIADVKVGTTQGASDLFAEDWSGGTFAAWDGTDGTVSIVPAPAFAGSGAHANAMLADSTVNANSIAWKNLASEPDVWLSVVAGFDAAALAGWTAGAPNDFNSGYFGAVFTSTNPTSTVSLNGAVYITALADPGPPAVYEEPLWRFVVTNLDLEIITFLDSLSRDRRLEFTLNNPAMATGTVPSDNPEVNISQAGHAFLSEGRRCLLGFRREGGTPPWVIRFAGIILQLEDSVDEDSSPSAISTYTAWDPWKYMMVRPVLRADGSLPGPSGVTFVTTPANEIATALLDRTFLYHGETHIMTGNVQTCPEVPRITFAQGSSVGEAWQQLCEAGWCDITMTPVYDPIGHPSKLVAIGISELAGRTRPRSSFAWAIAGENLSAMGRLIDGTQRANEYQGYAGQGGPPADALLVDPTSVLSFGEYWAQEWFPGKSVEAAAAIATERLAVRKNGITTYKVSPLPEPSPRPFIDYALGDCVPVWASDRLRAPVAVGQRILTIPIEIDDSGVERVSELGFSQDGTTTCD